MENNQKGLRAVKPLVVLVSLIVIVGLLVFAGRQIWHKQASTSQANTQQTINTACPNIAQTDNKSFQLPSGWQWHEIKDAGVKFAYPENWSSPTDQTNSGIEKYAVSFTIGKSDTNIMVTLSPDCSDFQTAISDINNGEYDTTDDSTVTRTIKHDQLSYYSLIHWPSDAGNQYQLVIHKVLNVDRIKSVLVEFSVIAGSQTCPDDRLASNDQTKCIDQAVSDEVDKVISSLQKI